MAKPSGLEAYSDSELQRIAAQYEEYAAQARSVGKQAPEWDFIAKATQYIVILRGQIADKKKPGVRERAA